jgi:ATP-binding cassette subfamily C protein LapB
MNILFPLLMRLAQVQSEPVDRLAMQAAIEQIDTQSPGLTDQSPREAVERLIDALQLPKARWIRAGSVDPANCPCLIHRADQGWALLRGRTSQNEWLTETFDAKTNRWVETPLHALNDWVVVKLKLARPYDPSGSEVYKLIRREIFSRKKIWAEGVLAGLMINSIALATSFYSMQVYDRVVPTGASQTLWVLTTGVLLAIFFETLAKLARSRLFEQLVDQVDQKLAREVYSRFLAIRLDQLPRSVGSLASQLKGYETVRSFLTSLTSHLMIDVPFALFFLLIIGWVGGWLAVIPLVFFCISLGAGLFFRRRVDVLSKKANAATNFKTGLLVETVEGAETIKSGQSGWRMLSRWIGTTDEARDVEQEMRRVSEYSQFLVAAMQQISYVLLVAVGSLQISRGELTMGGLIACSILSGRVLGPVAALPDRLIQWAHTRTALQGLDRIWTLQDDHHGQEQAIAPQTVKGHYSFEKVAASYGQSQALSIAELQIRPGEKIGVLGPIGAGKTTFLRLLSGMYKPQAGIVKMDGLDLAHISKPVLAERVGYLQQEGRLFAGTLRENLILGLIDPGDDVILEAARTTGLMQSVISAHPQGLQQMIHEGGSGLSSGQRQLVNLTRVFLRRPRIWLLDEPTASMDGALEQHILAALSRSLQPEDVLVVVTHKPELLRLVGRIIVVANHQIVMDGPKDVVLQRLSAARTQSGPAAAGPTTAEQGVAA